MSSVPAAAATLALVGYLSWAALWWLGRVTVLVGQRPDLVGADRQVSSLGGHGHGGSYLVFGSPGAAVCQSVMAAATTFMLIVMW
jgi:hypothetical protein